MINPTYRLLMSYDIHPDKYERYYRYMIAEFVPTMGKLGLHMLFVWQIYHNNNPSRQVEFVCQDRETLRTILTSDIWTKSEARIKSYTTRYQRKIVRFQDRLLQL